MIESDIDKGADPGLINSWPGTSNHNHEIVTATCDENLRIDLASFSDIWQGSQSAKILRRSHLTWVTDTATPTRRLTFIISIEIVVILLLVIFLSSQLHVQFQVLSRLYEWRHSGRSYNCQHSKERLAQLVSVIFRAHGNCHSWWRPSRALRLLPEALSDALLFTHSRSLSTCLANSWKSSLFPRKKGSNLSFIR